MPRSIDAHRLDCPCAACKRRRGLAKAHPNDNKLTVRLRPDVIDWLRLQPDGPARAIEHLVDGAAQPDPRR